MTAEWPLFPPLWETLPGAADFKPLPEAPLYIYVEASDLSENRFALFGPMLLASQSNVTEK